jgi:peroxin-5
MLQHTRALEATMASNSDPKFKNSKFLQFLSKMSNGEVILEDNQVYSSAWPITFYFLMIIYFLLKPP